MKAEKDYLTPKVGEHAAVTRIRELLRERELDPYDAARLCGFTENRIAMVLDRVSKRPTVDLLAGIETGLRVRSDWLRKGIGPRDITATVGEFTFGDLANWSSLEADARANAAKAGMVLPERAWIGVRGSPCDESDTPDADDVFELACAYARTKVGLSWGRPATGPQPVAGANKSGTSGE